MKNKILLLSAAVVLAVSSQSFASDRIEADETETSNALVFVANPSSFVEQRDELLLAGNSIAASFRGADLFKTDLLRADLLKDLSVQLKDVKSKLDNISRSHENLNAKLADAREEAAAQTGKDHYRANDIIAFLEQARPDVATKAFENHMVAKDGNKERLYAIRRSISGSSDDIYAFNEQFAWARGLLTEIQDKIMMVLVG